MKKYQLKKIIVILIIILIFLSNGKENSYNLLSVSGEPNTAVNLSYAYQFGSLGTENGQFNLSIDVAVNQENIFVVDFAEDSQDPRVQILDLEGNYISKFSCTGGVGNEVILWSLAINDEHIFVPCTINIGTPTSPVISTDVQIYDLSGNFISKFGSFGTGDGQLEFPTGIAVSETNIFVADIRNSTVSIFDLAGNFVSKFGSNGTADGQFYEPWGVTVNQTNVFVSDYSNNRIQIFDLSGNFISKFSLPTSIEIGPTGITVNANNIFVSDTGNSSIRTFDLAGNLLNTFGSFGTGDGQFDANAGIALNETHLFVADTRNSRVQILQLNFPPVNLVSHSSIAAIGLTWEPPEDYLNNPVITYRVYKRTQLSEYVLYHESSFPNFSDLNAEIGETYYYAVTAVTGFGETMYSNEVIGQLSEIPTITQTDTFTETDIVSVTHTTTETITGTDTQTVTETTTEVTSSTHSSTTNVTKTVYDIKTTDLGTGTVTILDTITKTEISTKTEESPFPIVSFILFIPLIVKLKKLRSNGKQ